MAQDSKETVAAIRQQLTSMTGEFASALPAQIPSEKFARVCMTAIQLNPDLLEADRRSLFAAIMRAAQDGLLPDGREGALVIYNTRVKVEVNGEKRDVWRKIVQWMPMVGGLMKKARNSGLIASLTAEVVREKDLFRRTLGDNPSIHHEPADDEENAGAIRGAYAIAVLRDGSVIRQWVPVSAIETIRGKSRAKDSLMWTDFYDQGAIKTAIRRLCKYLPSSSDNEGMESFLRTATRDDDTVDLSERTALPRPQPQPQLAAPAEAPMTQKGKPAPAVADLDQWADEREAVRNPGRQAAAPEPADDSGYDEETGETLAADPPTEPEPQTDLDLPEPLRRGRRA